MKILFLFVFSFCVYAEDCPSVRYDQKGGPLANIPLYDDSPVSKRAHDPVLAYAISAATLIDAYRNSISSTPITTLTSPISLAAHYHSEGAKANSPLAQYVSTTEDYRALGIGDVERTLIKNLDQSVCDEKFLAKFDGLIGAASSNRSAGEFLENTVAAIKEAKASTVPAYFAGILGNDAALRARFLEAVQVASKETLRPSQIEQFVNTLCKGHAFSLNYPSPQTVTRRELTGDKTQQMADAISEGLRKRPVGVNFCSIIFQVANSPGRDEPGFNIKDCRGLSIVVAGQQFNHQTNKCQLLVRMGFGPSCADWQDRKWTCNNGVLSIDKEAVAKMASQVQTIGN